MKSHLIRWTPESRPGPHWREPDGRSESLQEPSRGTIAGRCDQQRLSGCRRENTAAWAWILSSKLLSTVAELQVNIHPEGNFEPSGKGRERLRPSEDVQENESNINPRFTSKGKKILSGKKNLLGMQRKQHLTLTVVFLCCCFFTSQPWTGWLLLQWGCVKKVGMCWDSL